MSTSDEQVPEMVPAAQDKKPGFVTRMLLKALGPAEVDPTRMEDAHSQREHLAGVAPPVAPALADGAPGSPGSPGAPALGSSSAAGVEPEEQQSPT